jgi:hypothetical protein
MFEQFFEGSPVMNFNKLLRLVLAINLFFCIATSKAVKLTTMDLCQAVSEGDFYKITSNDLKAALQKRDNQWQCTPLHIAVLNHDKAIIQLLLAAGKGISGVIDAQDWLGCTPLFCALHIMDEIESASIVELLLKAGANATIKGNDGLDLLTPYEYARKKQYKHVAGYIASFLQ